MAEIEPKTREEKLWNGEDIKPLTREEMYIKHIFDKTQTIPDHPITRKEMLMEKAGEGGGGDITIKQLTATENRTYSEEGTAYSPVIVNVPDVPPVLDELTVTENGTYTPPSGTDGYNEVTVSVPLPPNAYLLKEIEDVAIASFNDGADLPMPKLEVAIEPQQEGSGEPSPTNVRPIRGWDRCNVTRCGANFLAMPIALYSIDETVGNCYYMKKGDYTISYSASETHRLGLRLMDADGNLFTDTDHIPRTFWTYNNNTKSYYTGSDIASGSFSSKITLVEDCYIRVVSNKASSVFTNAQLELGSTATTYEPYNGHTYTINFVDGSSPLTVYGGTLDVVSGVLTVTHKNEVFVGNISEGWYDASSGNILRFATIRNDMKKTSTRLPLLNNIARFSAGNENNICFGVTLGGNSIVYYYADSSVTNLSELYTWLSNNNMQIVYPLETPTTYQLTPTEVKTILGINNICADTGNILEGNYFAKEVSL